MAQNLQQSVPVPSTKSFARLIGAMALVAMAGMTLPGAAAPVGVEESGALQSPSAVADFIGGESPVDVERWVRDEAARALLIRDGDAERRALLEEGWRPRPPTWIQASTVVNVADYPSLDDSVARTEREMATLQWVLDEQRRQAAGTPTRPGDDEARDGSEDDPWIRKLMPRHWISALKANREWVAAGGTVVLALIWGASIFARRPGAPTELRHEPPPPPAPEPRRRHRHRRRHLLPQ